MKRRRLRFVVIASAAAVALYSACTISTITFAPTTDGATGTDAADGSDPFDAPFDSQVVPSDAAEASMAEGGRVDEASVEAGCCDCDKDGYRNGTCDASTWDGSAAIDCDDLAPDIHPDAGYTTGPWPDSAHKKYDWNCNGNVEEELRSDFSGCTTSNTCADEGFQGDPGCSQTGNYYKCSPQYGLNLLLIGCTSAFSGQTQACK